jgi:hypothetical protein
MKHPVSIALALALPLVATAELALTSWVPNRWLPQGELRLYTEAAGPRIEIVLHTRHLDRVLRAIEQKERANWGDHPEAARYLAALARARAARTLVKDGARENFVIEFQGGAEGGIRFLTATIETTSGAPGLRMSQPVLIASYNPAADYLHRNMALILADRLGIPLEEASARLRGPPS